MIGTIDMPAIAPAAATAIRIGVPGTTIPSTATASMIAAVNAITIASTGYCAAKSAAPLISDHTLPSSAPVMNYAWNRRSMEAHRG